MDVIGVDVGGTKIAAGTVRNGKLIDAIEIPILAKASANVIFSQICSVIDPLLSKKVNYICVGVPGVVNPKTSNISFATNLPKFKRVPLKRWLSTRYDGKQIFVQNDAKSFALGQLSTNKSDKHIVGLILGTGVGAGVIMNRKIVTGKDGSFGEVGAWIGSNGKSFEKTLGGHDFVKQFHASGIKLFERAKRRDKKTLALFKSYGEHLAELIAIITVTYAPQRIVLGGSVSKSAKYFLPTTKRTLARLKLAPQIKLPTITVAIQRYAGVLGAAALATSRPRAK